MLDVSKAPPGYRVKGEQTVEGTRVVEIEPEVPLDPQKLAADCAQKGGAVCREYAKSLLGRDNVILTPHTAFYSIEALEELQTKCASDVARVLSGEAPVYPVKTG